MSSIDFIKNACRFTQDYFSLVVFILNSANQYFYPLFEAEAGLSLVNLYQKILRFICIVIEHSNSTQIRFLGIL
ncbi:MAG: hypothetical protein CBC22_03635 [Alphaproteobacteria bacterium TMED62]|nr:MAG: hypothetical protein CBC22_03635 [Alphaproteobacteria bacterium TMED62]